MANWHSFQALGRFFLFDVQSNSLFNIDEAVHQHLEGRPLTKEIRERVEGELQELKEAGYLPETHETEPGYKRTPLLKALCLHVSHDCNLRCRYCFAGTGPFGGNREHMSPEVGCKALDLLFQESGTRDSLEVDFFGGEPLMNLETVRAVVAYGQEKAAAQGKSLHFTLTTNGINLDGEAREFLNDHNISLVLSLDGRPEVNDRLRGEGSYQRVLPHFLDLIQSRGHKDYNLRGTFTAFNPDFTKDVKHLYDLGFREISLEPVVAASGEYRLTEAIIDRIEAEYADLAAFYQAKKKENDGFHFFHFEISLLQGPCLLKRLTGCGAGFDYMAVTPAGGLYPCHQFVGREGFLMGDVIRGIIRDDLRREFGEATLYHKKGCAECWSRFYCSGGCHANAHLFHGTIYKPDEIGCRLQRKRLECALALKGLELL